MLQFNKPIGDRTKKLFTIAMWVTITFFVIAVLFPIVMLVIGVFWGAWVLLTG